MSESGKKKSSDRGRVERARARLGPTTVREHLARLQKALCEPARLKIVQALRAGPLPVKELAAAIGRAPEATSQHLRVLRDLGVVERTRNGTHVHYRLCTDGASADLQEVLETAERTAAERH